MKRQSVFFFITTILLLIFPLSTASAQSLYFGVESTVINVTWDEDGSMTLDYKITFANTNRGGLIDFVDIGMPLNSSYNVSRARAELDGHPLSDLTYSDYVDNAIAIGLGQYAIKPGERGVLHFRINEVKGTVYRYTGTDRTDYVSVNFQPNYFESGIVDGKTDLTVIFHLPPGITAEEPVYYEPTGGWPGAKDPETSFDSDGRVQYGWRSTEASSTQKYIFGAAWPQKYVPAATILEPPPKNVIKIDEDSLCCIGFGLVFALFFDITIYAGTIGAKKRKLQYLPPKISIEGHGIKRGLTAVEAAILLEQPLDRVLTMILFSVIKKNAAEVTKKDPLELKVVSPAPEGLHEYEKAFLVAFKEKSGSIRRKALQSLIIDLVKSVGEKMKGFSRKETIAYYKNIILEAWKQVEAAGTPEVKGEKFGEVMEWTMLDGEFEDRTKHVFRTGPVIVPTWWGRYDPVFRPTGGATPRPVTGGTSSGAPGGTHTITLPTLPGADFAGSVVNSVQGFASGVVGNITEFTSGVTNRTNPIPVQTTTRSGSSGRSGGSSCACACACACAGCACACAGGGR